MSDFYTVRPVPGPVRGTIRPPGSKSITNRARIVAALAQGTSTLEGVLDSQDTRVMLESLARLGLTVTHEPGECRVTLAGCAGRPPAPSAELGAAGVLRALLREDSSRSLLCEVPFFLDEIHSLDAVNRHAILSTARRLGFIAITAAPESVSEVASLYFLQPHQGRIVLRQPHRIGVKSLRP